jgi:hypothetical protein
MEILKVMKAFLASLFQLQTGNTQISGQLEIPKSRGPIAADDESSYSTTGPEPNRV